MVDLVGTCPKDFWCEWIAEGDGAGEPWSGNVWSWYTRHRLIREISWGERFYVVAHGRLRGYAICTGFERNSALERVAIQRQGGAVAVTIAEAIPGFRGLRKRWWPREAELPFAAWREVAP